MSRRTLITFLSVLGVILISACTKEIPMKVNLGTGQLSIEGTTVHVIHADTSDVILIRDSIPDEGSRHYTVRTSITLVLDSLFYTDQMVDSMALKLFSPNGEELATLIPADSLIVDTLIVYLQKEAGEKITIDFYGNVSGESILRLQKDGKAEFRGFSFVYADPKISDQVNEYEEMIHTISIMVEDARQNPQKYQSMEGFVAALVLQEAFNRVEAVNIILLGLKEKMSPMQYARFKVAHDLMKTYDKDLK